MIGRATIAVLAAASVACWASPAARANEAGDLEATITVSSDTTSDYGGHGHVEYSGKLQGSEEEARTSGILTGVMRGGGTLLPTDGEGNCSAGFQPGHSTAAPTSLPRVRLHAYDGRWQIVGMPDPELEPGNDTIPFMGGTLTVDQPPPPPDPDGCQWPGPSAHMTVTLSVRRLGCSRTDAGAASMSAACDDPLTARIAPLRPVARGDAVTFDGSESTGPITKYEWGFKPGRNCPKGTRLAAGPAAEKISDATVLCDVTVTLTVHGRGGKSAPAKRDLKVRARKGLEWEILRNVNEQLSVVTDQNPNGVFAPPDPLTEELQLGENDCMDGTPGNALCLPAGEHWSSRYDLEQVTRGPFKRFSYVTGATLQLLRAAFINPWFRPDAPVPWPDRADAVPLKPEDRVNVYTRNAAVDPTWRDSYQYLLEHEGYGFGPRRSGHEQAFLEAIAADHHHNDPLRYLETRFGPDEQELVKTTDSCLNQINGKVAIYASDTDFVDPHGDRHARDLEPYPHAPTYQAYSTKSRAWKAVPWKKEPKAADVIPELARCARK